MPHSKSGTFDLANGAPPLVASRLSVSLRTASPARRISNSIRALAARFLAWRARQLTLRMLSSLDSATLRDLGLTDIESEVYGDPTDRMRGYDADWRKKRGFRHP